MQGHGVRDTQLTSDGSTRAWDESMLLATIVATVVFGSSDESDESALSDHELGHDLGMTRRPMKGRQELRTQAND